MKLLALDWEATGAQRNKANPFDERNKGMCISLVSYETTTGEYTRKTYDFEYSPNSPYLVHVNEIQKEIDSAGWVIGMNLKYDMHWCRRYGIDLGKSKLWDVQPFYFILTKQLNAFPSLNDIATYHNLPVKLDIVKTQYWDQGLDTDAVPWETLKEYCEWDTELTLRICLEQMKIFSRSMSKGQKALIRVTMKDLHNLADMEWNGFIYDLALSQRLSEEVEASIATKTAELKDLLGFEALPEMVRTVINFNSNDHLSALLYGGVIKYVEKVPFLFEYKPDKKGNCKPPVWKTKNTDRTYECSRLLEPLPKTELAKKGFYSTNEDTLLKLKTNKHTKKIVTLLLELSKLEKLNGTYYKGFPKLLETQGWGNVIHSGFNQCVAITGRLSSTKPNMQNVPSIHKVCFKSRWE